VFISFIVIDLFNACYSVSSLCIHLKAVLAIVLAHNDLLFSKDTMESDVMSTIGYENGGQLSSHLP